MATEKVASLAEPGVALKLVFHECPTCKAQQDAPCRTPQGRKKRVIHDTRPFSIARI